MRIEPFCEYIADQLSTSIACYDKEEQLIRMIHPNKIYHEIFLHHPDLLSHLLSSSRTDYPMYTIVNRMLCYIHFQTIDGIYVIGPIHLADNDSQGDYARHTYTIDDLHDISLSAIPVADPGYTRVLCLPLYNSYQEHNLSESSCSDYNFDSALVLQKVQRQAADEMFANRENNKSHNSYDQETRLLRCIEDGNLAELDSILAEPSIGHLGTTAKDPIRNGKNMCIYNISSNGRAAIRAGVTAEYVFSMIDSYCQQVEEIKDTMLLGPLVDKATHHFTQMVADLKKQQALAKGAINPLVQQCKTYVFAHLHDKLTVTEIANELHVHPNYLSSLFHEQEGLSLYQYIQQQKIDLVKNLLTYSSYSYIDIANYLGFTSQSHLGSKFKAATGMTLKQYRDTNKKEEFLSN